MSRHGDRPSAAAAARLAPSRPPPRSSRDTPAPPLGPAEETNEAEAPDSVRTRGGRMGTVPLRPLIDIGQAGLTLTVEREAGKVVQRDARARR